jgi:hypothetical protein
MSAIADLRRAYHAAINTKIIRISAPAKAGLEYPNFADGSNRSSIEIAWGVRNQLSQETPVTISTLAGQTKGNNFEDVTAVFLESAFSLLRHLRPGRWYYSSNTAGYSIASFDQYNHLAYLASAIENDPNLEAILGGVYIVKPDILVARWPVEDVEINEHEPVLENDPDLAQYTSLRAQNHHPVRPILHASISCKWTIRSDRTQNTRTEALNLIRNRKGHLPHVVAVTAEPLPTRIAAIALGTGDLDCVYHFALPELREAIRNLPGKEDQLEMLNVMVDGGRLRDISDLPFDLAV